MFPDLDAHHGHQSVLDAANLERIPPELSLYSIDDIHILKTCDHCTPIYYLAALYCTASGPYVSYHSVRRYIASNLVNVKFVGVESSWQVRVRPLLDKGCQVAPLLTVFLLMKESLHKDALN